MHVELWLLPFTASQCVATVELQFPELPQHRRLCMSSEVGSNTFNKRYRCSCTNVVRCSYRCTRRPFAKVRNLQRCATQLQKHMLLNWPLVQLLDDRNPFYFLFGFLNSQEPRPPWLLMTECTFISPCGGRGPQDVVNSMLKASTDDLHWHVHPVPFGQVSSPVLTVGVLRGVPTQGDPATIIAAESRIECYNPAISIFPAAMPPAIWNAGAATGRWNPYDLCFRPETMGADYRGTINVSFSGAACQKWVQPNHEVTPRAAYLHLLSLCLPLHSPTEASGIGGCARAYHAVMKYVELMFHHVSPTANTNACSCTRSHRAGIVIAGHSETQTRKIYQERVRGYMPVLLQLRSSHVGLSNRCACRVTQ